MVVRSVWIAVMLGSLLLVGCSSPAAAPPVTQPADATKRLPIVATFSIPGEFVQRIGGDRVALTTLVGPGGDAHTFEPTPEDGKALAQARLVIENGAGFEGWLDDLYAASGSTAQRVVLASVVDLLPIAEEGHTSADDHGEFDPHIWHDVNNAIRMVEQIRDRLIAADPANAATYTANATAYLTELRELDGYVQAEVARLPPERRKLVTTHDTFGYFAKRYGFVVIGTGLGSASTDVTDPSPATLGALVNAIKATGVPAIFAENVSSAGVMETIAREAGVQLGPPLYTDALGMAGSPGATYVGMMRANVDAIVTALQK